MVIETDYDCVPRLSPDGTHYIHKAGCAFAMDRGLPMEAKSVTKRTFAVSFFSMHSNELHTELLHAETWKDAAVMHAHSVFKPYANEDTGDIESPISEFNTIAEAKTFAFDCDGGFDIIELDISFDVTELSNCLDSACIVCVGEKEIQADEYADAVVVMSDGQADLS